MRKAQLLIGVLLPSAIALMAHSLASAQEAAGTAASPGMIVRMNLMVPMRDGVRLSTDIYRPARAGRYPAILVRDPNGNGSGQTDDARQWVERAYVYIHQDTRGRNDSEGHHYPYVAEGNDGYDTQQWIARQAWSNGNVGMTGISYAAGLQWMTAPLRSPALKAIAPVSGPFSWYNDLHYIGGASALSSRLHWAFFMGVRTGQKGVDEVSMRGHLPLKTLDEAFGYDLTFWRDWIEHPSYDFYWKTFDLESRVAEMDTPALNVGGWYDGVLQGTLVSYIGMRERAYSERAREGQKLVIGPWYHGVNRTKIGELDFGDVGTIGFEDLQARWFDHWLKGEDNGVMDEPRVLIFVMGENRWRAEDDWPLKRAQYTKYYLQGSGGLSTARPSALNSTDQYVYDPADPVPTKGGNVFPLDFAGPVDQGDIGNRDDVLVFVTEPLSEDAEATGPITVTLYAASSALDTDFTAKLIDVHPDGKAYNLADGIIRARYRNSFEKPELLEPGKVYEYRIDLWATSNLFKKGHRIRVDISSSNFPRFDRNPNTGHKFGEDAELKTAQQTIYHSRRYSSHITLPIIPR